MNRNLISLAMIFLLLGACSTAQAGPNKYEQHNIDTVNEYFKNPKDKLLIIVEQIEHNGDGFNPYPYPISITLTVGIGNNSSKEMMTPFIMVLDLNDKFAPARKTFNALPKSDQPAALNALLPTISSELPPMSIVAQSQGTAGIQGAIYFSGEKKSESIANAPYGLVNLFCTITPEDVFKKSE